MTDQQLTIDQAMALAKQHAKNGRHATARDIYQRILAQQPEHAGAKRGLNKLPRDGKDKNNFRADMETLTAAYQGNDPEQALTLATRMSRKYKTQPMPLNIRGAILTRMDRLDEAIACFRKAIALEPNYPDVWSNLGMAYQLAGKPDDAIAAYQQLMGRSPNNIAAMMNLGRLYRIVGDLERSANLYERVLALSPDAVDALVGLGTTLRMIGEENSALTCLRAALDLEPNNPEAHREFGETLMQRKLFTASLEHLHKAAELDPANPFNEYNLGMALLSTGDKQAAASHLQRSIDVGSDRIPSAQHFLAIARGEKTAVAPKGYVEDLFDDYAGRFEKSLVGNLGYQGPEILSGLMERSLAGRRFEAAVDLGCGTGLMGQLVRDRVGSLTGIDLSQRMLDKAREKNVYDELIAGELVETLGNLQATPDLFVCADVLVYIGDLAPLFNAVKARGSKDAVFAFTTEKLAEGSFELLATGRYAHSDEFVKQAAEQAGFDLVAIEEAPLRREHREWLAGGYYILQAAG